MHLLNVECRGCCLHYTSSPRNKSERSVQRSRLPVPFSQLLYSCCLRWPEHRCIIVVVSRTHEESHDLVSDLHRSPKQCPLPMLLFKAAQICICAVRTAHTVLGLRDV